MIGIMLSVVALLVQTPSAISTPQSQTGTSTASMRIIGGSSFNLRWHGVGDLRADADLCVTSSTGRFQLELQSMGASAAEEAPKFEVVFTTRAGEQKKQKFLSHMVSFEGRTLGTDCTSQPNVKIQLVFENKDLSKATAGTFLDRLHVNVRPL